MKKFVYFLRTIRGNVRGSILSEICWNWLEIHTFILDEDIRKSGFGTKLLVEIEKIALEKECDFIKVDTLSFQALDFYQKNGYQVFGSLENVGRDYKHYYLKKDLKR
jgi:GNAT superfamily N-acetyltransferase